MTNINLAFIGLSGGELILILVVALVSVAMLGGAVILVVLLAFRRKSSTAPTPPAATQKIHQCLGCGAMVSPDAPEGLCPACLLKRGFATEGSAQPGQTPFVPPPPAELAGQFPQLEILELIGKGGMGAVYKARQPALQRLVALKILPPRSASDPGFAERFTREARALARLSHPNIVGVYDFGVVGRASSPSPNETGGTPVPLHYFIMEYVDGPNLRQIEQAGKLSPREALQIIPQICTALQFAHDEGIVHRDIKPENVLLDKKGRVKIADFGLAKILGHEPQDFRLTGAKDVMGTPHYMAPEQVEHPQDVDHRADIYSLGVVFYEMLTGELPLGKFQPPSAKVQVDVRLDEVVLHALAKEPDRRYQQASQVKTDVETIATTPELGSGPAERNEPASPESLGRLAPVATGVEPRFSRTAIVGACWAPWIFILFLATITLSEVSVAPGQPRQGPGWELLLLRFTVLPIGIFAPFGTTILGWIAVSQIRRSAGRLYGLGLAVFDGLLFPLLALDALIIGVSVLVARALAPVLLHHGLVHFVRPWMKTPALLLGAIVILLVTALVDFMIIRRVWRAVNKPVPFAQPMPPLPSPAQKPSRFGRFVVTVFVVVLALGMLGGIALQNLNKRHPNSAPRLVITGTITDAFNGRQIPGARVAAEYDHWGTGFAAASHFLECWTDAEGHFELSTWKEPYTFSVSALGYETFRQVDVATGDGDGVTRDIQLQPAEGPGVTGKSDYIGQSYFPSGDLIEITSVERSQDRMLVKGRYNLVSADGATLALEITPTNETSAAEDPQQSMQISRGRGAFELSRSHLVPGLPHVSMYADGHSFAAVYFGTKTEVAEERAASWITNAPLQTDPRNFSNVLLFINNIRFGDKNGGTARMESTGTFSCRLTNHVSEVSWKWLHATARGDVYQFTRVFPAGTASPITSNKEIVYSGIELVLWQDDVQRIVIRPARLQFQLVTETNDLAPSEDVPDLKGQQTYHIRKEVLLDDLAVATASLTKAIVGDSEVPEISIQFTEPGSARMKEISRSNIGKRLAIVFDGRVLSAPVINSEIDGSAVIEGRFTGPELTNIVNALNWSQR